MRKFLSFALVAFLALTQTSLANAAAPKPGAKCPKAGLTQTVAGKKYTCMKIGGKLSWNKGVTVPAKTSPSPTTSADATTSTIEPSSSPTVALVKFKNCTEVKAAGAAPLSKVENSALYELNSSLDRDKDGIACE
jgi:hypothetical protein